MTTLTRRMLILGASALALAACKEETQTQTGGGGEAAAEVDVAKLMEPPVHGEIELGPKDAKVTIVEYASASCPHCATFHTTVFPELRKNYIDTGKVRFVFREFPHNEPAMAAFMMARCAPADKYLAIMDVVFSEQKMWMAAPLDGLFKIGQAAGLTREKFDACLKDQELAKKIYSVAERGDKEFGVTGIPTFFVNGKRLNGEQTFEELKKVIDPLLG